MHIIFMIEVIIYIIGFILCLSSLFSTEWFNLSSVFHKPSNINGQTVDLFRVCTKFVNGTNTCVLYSCSNTSRTQDFCEDIIACRFGLLISSIAFLILNIISLIRGILMCYSQIWNEGICTCINVSLCGIVAFIGTAICVGYGSNIMPDLLQSLPVGLITYTIGSGYIMVIVSFNCAILCLILQCISCCNRYSRNNQPQIIYQYLPQPAEPQYNNPLFHNNINPQPPPTYTSKAGF